MCVRHFSKKLRNLKFFKINCLTKDFEDIKWKMQMTLVVKIGHLSKVNPQLEIIVSVLNRALKEVVEEKGNLYFDNRIAENLCKLKVEVIR